MTLIEEIISTGIECPHCPNEQRQVAEDGTIAPCEACGAPEDYLHGALPEPVDFRPERIPYLVQVAA